MSYPDDDALVQKMRGGAQEAVNHGARQIRLEPTARAARDARRFVSETLAELGHGDLIEDATLIASELTTNSLIHVPNLPIWVGIWETGAFLDLEVWDCSTKPPVYMDPDYLATGGRGRSVLSIRLPMPSMRPSPPSRRFTLDPANKAALLWIIEESDDCGVHWRRAE